MSGGGRGPLSTPDQLRDVQHPVGVAGVAPTPAPALDKLHQAELSQLVEVALDGARGAAEGSGQGLHFGPAEARLVVGVVREGAVGGHHLGGHPREDQVLHLRNTGELTLRRHKTSLKIPRQGAL